MDTVMLLADIAVRVILYGSGALAAFVLIVAALAPRATDTTEGDTSLLDDLDRPTLDGLTEWDLDHDTDLDDATTLCDAYPHECEWDDVHHTPDPWGPTTRVCHTHHREGADQ